MAIKVIYDCDTGGDDATAISIGVASKDIEVLGVTTNFGNLALRQTLRNTLELIDYLEKDIPVAKGSEVPLVRDLWVGSEAERRLPIDIDKAHSEPVDLPAWEFIADQLRKSDTKVTLIPLAPLTNIAKLMIFEPDLVREKVGGIFIMGGSKGWGNESPSAELNFYADPEAARVVFSFGMPIVLAGLDVCEKAYITASDVERFKDIDTKPAKVFYNICERGVREYGGHMQNLVGEPAIQMYDSLPVVYALHPEIFEYVDAKVYIETDSGLCDGMSICDTRPAGFHNSGDIPKLTKVLLNVDREKYFDILEKVFKEAE
ncbi:MAG: nucleoside hydrolase [Oscillospiraceae bacterium]|nr:nucleoside hydrolase [Oscillospiraceae bacterium]